MKQPEIICAGELLIDLISTEYADNFAGADTYQRLPGGSPANLATNLARLGRNVGLVAAVGDDDAGALLQLEAEEAGVDIAHLTTVEAPTTMILVTKSRTVSNFEAYRSADLQLTTAGIPDAYLQQCHLFHTTAFGLSREPARTAILEAAARVVEAGGRLSIDVNYAVKIWPDRLEALWVINSYLSLSNDPAKSTLVKCSDVDYLRLFDEPVEDLEEAGERLLDLGAGVVCLTLGERGCYVRSDAGSFTLPSRPVEVRDTTGAGDAFWSGFLAAHLAGHAWQECALAGRGMAEKKLITLGPLREKVDLAGLIGE